MHGLVTVRVLKKRPKLSPYPGEGYRRAKRSVRPWPLKVGSVVVYEDERGHVHRRMFDIITMVRGSRAVIKGWPDGVRRTGPKRRLLVSRAALVDIRHVRDEEFKASFGIPEDRPGTSYAAVYAGITRMRRRRKRVRR